MKILYLFELEAHIVGKEREKGIISNKYANIICSQYMCFQPIFLRRFSTAILNNIISLLL